MKIQCDIGGTAYSADLSGGLDISLSFGPGGDNPNAFGIPSPEVKPIKVGDFVGSVKSGSGANCDTIFFCAHGNVTHTECVGHITQLHESVNQTIREYFFTAQLITVPLVQTENGDTLVTAATLQSVLFDACEAIIVRTTPNDSGKKQRVWSGNNPPYFEPDALKLFRDLGFKHLLTDLPSVDKEQDDGVLAAHHVWWNYPNQPRMEASITELIYVKNEIKDGLYALNLQFAPLESDASPSRPVIFPLQLV